MPRRGENIFKRKDGRWEARYVKEVASDGSKKYASVYAKSYSEAKAKQQHYISQLAAEKESHSSITVNDVMNEWLSRSEAQVKISSFQKYSSVIQKHISKQIGNIRLSDLAETDINRFRDHLLTEDDLSQETVNSIMTILGMGMEYAKERYRILVPSIHLLKTSKMKPRILSEAEQQKLVHFLISEDDIFSFGILFALYTGLLIGELCALKWEDFRENTAHINKTMQRVKGPSGKTEIMILPPKNKSYYRVIPIAAVLQPIVQKYRKENGYVLTQKNGKHIEPRLLQNKFEKYVNSCGLDGVNFNTLRHTFATRCIETGMDAKTLSEILGHSDVRTILNMYVHSSSELKQKGVDKLTFMD